jgi:glycosyltransferase involved in cell wall biosynthesis
LVVFDLPGLAIPPSVDDVAVSVRPRYRAHERLGKVREIASIRKAISDVDADVLVTRIATPEVGVAACFAKLLGRRFVYSSSSLSDFVPVHRLSDRRLPADRSAQQGKQEDAMSSFDFSQLARKRRDWELFRLGIRIADEIVVQSEEQVRLCREHFGRTPVLIKSIAELAPQREHDPEAFLWIGRLVSSKRPLAFVELARAVPEAKFRMVAVPAMDARGGAELVAALERDAATVPNLELLAPRPRREVLNLVDRAVAVVSTADFEGMPNIFLEGWARGVPAVALRHDPDNVIERYALGGFAHGSSEELVDLTWRFWRERGAQADLNARCRDYVLRHHCPEVISARWQEALGIVPTAAATRSCLRDEAARAFEDSV